MDRTATNSCYMLNGEEWISLPDMKEAWNNPFCAAQDNSIYVVKDNKDKVEILDLSSLTWSTGAGSWMSLGDKAALFNTSTLPYFEIIIPSGLPVFLVSASEIGC